jgi:hypothetical protein
VEKNVEEEGKWMCWVCSFILRLPIILTLNLFYSL